MKIAFTICSNNYLAQAKVLIDSINRFSKNCKLYIGLCDEKSEMIDYSQYNCEIIEIKNIGINDFDLLWQKYNIIEMNTCVKASMFKYLIKKNPNAEFIYYFDPDICTFSDISVLDKEFENTFDILLTPHIISPIPMDEKRPNENIFLNYGLYNLGFLGLRASSDTSAQLLNWWEERTLKIGYNQVEKGMFVDQLWINFVPIYFKDKVKILYKMGYNAAPWNLHERIGISEKKNDQYVMPDGTELIFYHFSNYKYSKADTLTTFYDRFSLEDDLILERLYKNYLQNVLDNNIEVLSKIECVYIIKRQKYLNSIYKPKLPFAKKFLKKIFKRLYTFIQKM